MNIIDQLIKEHGASKHRTCRSVAALVGGLCPGWPEHWTNGGTGITKTSEPATSRYRQVIRDYGDPRIWMSGDEMHATMYDLSDFWEFERKWVPYNPYVPLSEKYGELAVIAVRHYDVPFGYGSTVKILQRFYFRPDALLVVTCSDTPIEGVVFERDLYWENKDNNHYP
jgi:hypothetical protein